MYEAFTLFKYYRFGGKKQSINLLRVGGIRSRQFIQKLTGREVEVGVVGVLRSHSEV